MANIFRSRSAELNLETGQVVDDETGEVKCYSIWLRDIAYGQAAEMDRLQRERDQSSDIINLPGNKPYFEYDTGIGSWSPRKGEDAVCKGRLP